VTMATPTIPYSDDYRPPDCDVGDRLVCALREEVTVAEFSDSLIRWPCTGDGQHIVTGDLIRAVRQEHPMVVCHLFGVSEHTYDKWRRALPFEKAVEGLLAVPAAKPKTDKGKK
jgi:hypothetical protein